MLKPVLRPAQVPHTYIPIAASVLGLQSLIYTSPLLLSICAFAAGTKYSMSHMYSLTAPPSTPTEIEAAVRLIQRELITHGPVPAIITETPEALYSYSGGVFSYTKPPPPPKSAAPATATAAAEKKAEPDLTSLFLTTAHAVTIVGWGSLDGKPFWKIGITLLPLFFAVCVFFVG